MKKKIKMEQGLGSFLWGVPAFLWQIIFLYIPLFFLFITSFIHYNQQTKLSHFNISHYLVFFDLLYFKILMRSLSLALITVGASLLFAYPVTYFLVLKMKRWKTFFFVLLVIPFWTNFLLLVYSWYFLLENNEIVKTLLMHFNIISEPLHMMNTKFAVYCGMFYCYLPFMLLPLYSTFSRFEKQFLEVCFDLIERLPEEDETLFEVTGFREHVLDVLRKKAKDLGDWLTSYRLNPKDSFRT